MTFHIINIWRKIFDYQSKRHTMPTHAIRHHDFFSEKTMESATLDCVETGALPLVNTLPTHAADTMIFSPKKPWNRLPSTASK